MILRGACRESEARRLHDRARGFRQYMATHLARGNSSAADEASAERKGLIEQIERHLASGGPR
jgi:hypothetical protein